MEKFEYGAQSYRWDSYTVFVPEEMAQAYRSKEGVLCSLDVAKDGNNTLIKVREGKDYIFRSLSFSGVSEILRGEGHQFLASSGSWSGGSNLSGAIALKPGAILSYGAKGNWHYLVAEEDKIRSEEHDPRLFEEGSKRWKPLV